MTNPVGIKLHNNFVATLYDSKTGALKQTVRAENLVTNEGYRSANAFNSVFGIHLVIGTGHGTPSVTDTALFNQLVSSYNSGTSTTSSITRIGDNQFQRKLTVKFSENECNGTLTEIGLGYQAYQTSFKLHTHALFTDAEGHAIEILKTNADTLTIVATVFLEITYTENSKLLWYYSSKANTNLAVDATATHYMPNDAIPSIASWILNGGNSSVGSIGYTTSSLPILSVSRTITYSNSIECNATSSIVTGTTTLNRRSTRVRILADAENRTQTYEIRSFYIQNDGLVVSCPLPNETVYPAKSLTLTQIADGTTQDFNFGIPHLLTTDAVVKIDDAIVPNSQYTFNGIDYTMAQGWESFDAKYVKQLINFNFNDYVVSGPGWSNTYLGFWSIDCRRSPTGNTTTDDYTIVYDFKQAYRVTTVANIMYNFMSSVIPTLWYSDDMENWTQVTGLWTNATDYQTRTTITLPTAITARYWKTVQKRCFISNGETNTWKNMAATIVFGDPKPQLHFNFVPAADATITVTAKAPYPIKNANWIIESGLTIDITASQSS